MNKKNIKIKICGMRDADNIRNVSLLQPDFIGFIFYSKSSRYVKSLDADTLKSISGNIKKIGVFVNQDFNTIVSIVKRYGLDGVQLHGEESSDMCFKIKKLGFFTIKAFLISSSDDFDNIVKYENSCDCFLFDTKTIGYGGSGCKFDWNLIDFYKGNTPFLLSGGIDLYDAESIKKINNENLIGVDINSKFEISPAFKDIEKLKNFINVIRN